MLKSIINLSICGFIIAGCSFGEYADVGESLLSKSSDKKYYEFSKKGIKNKNLYKVYKSDKKWHITRYHFEEDKNYDTKQIKNGVEDQNGTYNIMDEGYLELINSKTIYVKAIKKDKDKIFLLWTYGIGDLSRNTPTKNTYFFYSQKKADDFVNEQEDASDEELSNKKPPAKKPPVEKPNGALSAIYNLIL